MSERLFRFTTAEMKTLRIVCQNKDCGAVSELVVGKMTNAGPTSCHSCGKHFFSLNYNVLSTFAKMLESMNAAGEHATFEFTIPMGE